MSLQRFGVREERRLNEQKEREDLLRRVNEDSGFRSLVGEYDAESGARNSVRRSNSMVDELLEQGASVLGSLGEQSATLRNVKRKMFSLLDKMGVSTSLLRVIDRRQRLDAMLVYGGMFFTVVFCFILWWMFVA
jgi:Golgi SNAP receptor complex protein 2